MNNLTNYIIEKLKIDKNTKLKYDISYMWADELESTKYKLDAIYNILNFIKDKVDWDSKIESIYKYTFHTSLNSDDLEKLNKEVYTKDILDSHEYQYDWSKKSYFNVNIYKEHMLKIHNYLLKPNEYDLTLINGGKDFFDKYYNKYIKKEA